MHRLPNLIWGMSRSFTHRSMDTSQGANRCANAVVSNEYRWIIYLSRSASLSSWPQRLPGTFPSQPPFYLPLLLSLIIRSASESNSRISLPLVPSSASTRKGWKPFLVRELKSVRAASTSSGLTESYAWRKANPGLGANSPPHRPLSPIASTRQFSIAFRHNSSSAAVLG